MTWPYPGDSPLAIARKVAIAYRTHLRSIAPHLCDQLDDTMRTYGQTWVVPTLVTVPDDATLTAAQAAEYLHVSVARIRSLRREGRLQGCLVGVVWTYRAEDVRRLMATPRQRRRSS